MAIFIFQHLSGLYGVRSFHRLAICAWAVSLVTLEGAAHMGLFRKACSLMACDKNQRKIDDNTKNVQKKSIVVLTSSTTK